MKVELPGIIVEGTWKEMMQQVRRSLARQALLEALTATHWHRRKAARMLGISYRQLQYLLNFTGIRKQIDAD